MLTDGTKLQEIKTLLQKEEVQNRIRENVRRVRDGVRVTIGRAAELSGLSEPKLRELDKLRVVIPGRSEEKLEGQRQYSQQNLETLAIISSLLKSGIKANEIPANVDELWQEISSHLTSQRLVDSTPSNAGIDSAKPEHINLRIENARKALFWRYYASHVLRLSAALISEEVPGTPVGLLLPVQNTIHPSLVKNINELSRLGPCLVGWLSKSKSSHTLYTAEPSFQYSTDYDLLPLALMKDERVLEEAKDATYIILDRQDRRSYRLTLTEQVVAVIRRLLHPLHENKQLLQEFFGPGMRDAQEPSTDLSANHIDIILNGLADMIVSLGGYNANGESRWRFCCILLPEDISRPLHKRALIVHARSENAPETYKIGATTVSSATNPSSLSLRVFRSGHILYREVYRAKEPIVAYSDVEIEEDVRSAIAVPIGGEDGFPLGALYVGSSEAVNFSESDLSVLRLMSRMVQELLKTFEARLSATKNLRALIRNPMLVDATFKDFFSENDFRSDVKQLLATMQEISEDTAPSNTHSVSSVSDGGTRPEQRPTVVSFIAVDVDNAGKLATKYGERFVNNLNQAVGMRIGDQIRTLFKKSHNCTLYHIYSDLFYLMLKEVPLEEAREKAELLRQDLGSSYQIDALRTTDGQTSLTGGIDVKISARLGVTSYTDAVLKGILQQYPSTTALTDVSAVIIDSLTKALADGWHDGGNCVYAWDATSQRLARWSP